MTEERREWVKHVLEVYKPRTTFCAMRRDPETGETLFMFFDFSISEEVPVQIMSIAPRDILEANNLVIPTITYEEFTKFQSTGIPPDGYIKANY